MNDSLRASLIQQLNAYAHDEEAFLNHVDEWAAKEGDRVYSAMVNVFTQMDFEEREARDIWTEVIRHRQMMMESLNRKVNLITAICDYMLTVKKSMIQPKVVEMDLFEETSHFSKCDRMTGLYNRAFIEDVLRAEASRSMRYKNEFSLVFFDLDHFKNINDTHGHLAGDYVLQSIARLIQAEKRTEDVAARYGGEEILLVLPETEKYNALTIAERLRRKIQRLDLEFEGKPLQVTVSGGVATFPVDTDVQGDLMDCADRALYRAKTLGRNRICLFSPDKRHFYRMDMLGPVKVQELGMKVNQKPALARIKDLSLSGMLFEVQEPLSLSSRIQMEVPLSSRETPLVLVGQVTRVQPHGANYNIGATFLHFGEQDRAALNQHFSSTLRTQIPMA